MNRAVVVGAGIAGLAAAASLRDHGWQVTVLERSATPREVGAGLALTPNGQAALAALGVLDAADAAGARTGAATVSDHHGRLLMRMTDDGAAELIGIHRRRLHRILRERAGGEVQAGTGVLAVEAGDPDGARAVVRTADGELEADLVVGADGVHSVVRESVVRGVTPTYSGHTCWRGISPVLLPRFTMAWGPSSEVGALRVGAQETYWYVYVPAPVGGRAVAETPPTDERQAARNAVAGWPAAIGQLIAATEIDDVLRNDVHRIITPLPSYVHGRVVLVGDAAHAMLPTLGQGANTSLEDGVSLGPLLAGRPLAAGLAHFDGQRRPRTQRVAAASEQVARVGAHLQPRLARGVRNSLMRLVPAVGAQRGTSWLTGWQPPVAG